jgi:thiol-disulfide isomerase/thioredoxin
MKTKTLQGFAIALMFMLAPPGVRAAEERPDFFTALQSVKTVQLGKPQVTKGPAIVQFWASWCVGCRPAMENALVKTENDFDGENNIHRPSIRFVTVSMDDDPMAARKYLERAGTLAPKLIDATIVDTAHKLAEKLQVKAVPTMLFVKSDGSIAGRIVGHGSQVEFDRLSKLISQGH